MARVCEICGKGTVAGRSYATRGLAKRKKGAGIKITGITKRSFSPNLVKKRIIINGKVKTAKICTTCLRSGKVVLAK
ncbi:MAG: 50S ribosomal protein L28 [Spirochaetes bacterium]|nr:MAG: 50S ribosomal protein L28 [Spirochaetota bacterium]